MYDKSDIATTDGGGHVVHIVGYIDNDSLASNTATKSVKPGSGGGYFIIKNSLGECHGDAGYYYMPVDYLTARATGAHVVSSESH